MLIGSLSDEPLYIHIEMYLFNMIFSPSVTYPNDFFIIKMQGFFFNKMNLVFLKKFHKNKTLTLLKIT